jgi:hypothetical protein
MIANENQERLVKEYLKYIVDDPLNYEEFKYPLNEWDNIPPIIPRFILTMNQHLKSIVHACREKFKEEKTQDLRLDLEKQNEILHQKIDRILEDQQEVNRRIQNTVATIDRNNKNLDDRYELFQKKYKELTTQPLSAMLEK